MGKMEDFIRSQEQYTPEEMEALDEAGYFDDQGFFSDADLSAVSAAGTGAVSGFSTGGVTGAIAGAAGGLIVGGIEGERAERLKREAILRDIELEKELDAVDNLEEYITATSVGSAGQRQESTMQARQAAARAGLGEAAGQDLARQAGAMVDTAQSKATAQAMGVANQADIADKQSILQEEFGRQELFSDAASYDSALSDLGELGGSLAEAAQTKDSEVATSPVEGEADASGKSVEGQSSDAARSTSGSSETPEETKDRKDKEMDDSLRDLQQERLSEKTGASMETSTAQKKEARAAISADLQSGKVSAAEFKNINNASPDAMDSPEQWSNAVENMLRETGRPESSSPDTTYGVYSHDPSVGYPGLRTGDSYARERFLDMLVE